MTFAPHDTTGRSLFDLRPEDFEPETIARVLSRLPRFLGRPHQPWSVADHSVAVAQRLEATGDTMACRWGLLHDAAEIFLGDVPTPLKRDMYYRDPRNGVMYSLIEVEERILRVVALRYDLPWSTLAAVVEADGRQLASEIGYLFVEPDAARYAGGYEPWPAASLAWPPTWRYDEGHPRAAERRWMDCYRELFERR